MNHPFDLGFIMVHQLKMSSDQSNENCRQGEEICDPELRAIENVVGQLW